VGIASGVGSLLFGLRVGAVVIVAAVLAAPVIDPTWRLLLSFAARNRQWREAAVASAGRLVWILGYVSGSFLRLRPTSVKGAT